MRNTSVSRAHTLHTFCRYFFTSIGVGNKTRELSCLLLAILYAVMTSILHLSGKTLNNLLRYMDVSIEDVINLSLTCKQLQQQIRDEQFWRYKFFQRWPSLKDVCEMKWESNKVSVKAEVLTRLKCRDKLLNYIESLYKRYYYRDALTKIDLKDFEVMFSKKEGAHFMNIYYMEDELLSNVNLNPANEGTNLRVAYYSKRLLFYLKYCRLEEKWEELGSQPPRQQVLEKVFAILLQYIQFKKCISTATVMRMLDSLIIRVLSYLRTIFPNHPLFQMSTSQLDLWKYSNIEKNYWNGLEAWPILRSLKIVMYKEIKELPRDQSSYINNILNLIRIYFHQNIQILWFTAIFHAVARRLGVRCDIKYWNHKNYFALTWKTDYNSNNIKGNCFFIDVFHAKFVNAHSIEDLSVSDIFDEHKSITPLQFMLRASEHLQFHRTFGDYFKCHLFTKIKNLLQPQDVNEILKTAYSLEHYIIDFTDMICTLNEKLMHANLSKDQESEIKALVEKFSQPIPQFPIIIHKRTENLKFAIGMIMECTVGESDVTTGVIFGWDTYFRKNTKTSLGEEIVCGNTLCSAFQNGVQPYYKILTTNRKLYYISQDMVKPLLNEIIYHPDIGRFFCYYKKTHYVPNSMLEREYPDDAAVRDRWISSLKVERA